MALKVADLVATLSLDAKGLTQGVQRESERLKTDLTKSVRTSTDAAGKELVTGLEKAAHDAMDDVTRAVTADGQDLERAADRAGSDAGKALADGIEDEVRNLSSTVDPGEVVSRSEFGAVGEQAGEALADGIESGVRSVSASVDPSGIGSRGEWSAEGEQLGEAFADGVEDGVDDGGGAVGSAVDGLLSGLPAVVTGPAGAAGAAIAALLVTGMSKALSEEENRKKLAAALDLEGADARAVGDVADNLIDSGYDAEPVMEATVAVRSTFDDSELRAGLEDGVLQAIAFADRFEASITEAVAGAGLLVENGMAKDLTEAFDLMSETIANAPLGSRDELISATEEYAQFFAGLGIDGPKAFAVLAAAADKGRYVVDKLPDSLKEFGIVTRDATDETRAAWDKLDLPSTFGEYQTAVAQGGQAGADALTLVADALLSIEDPSERARTAIAVFGTPFEDVAGSADTLNGVLTALASEGMTNFEGQSAKNVESMDTMQAKVDETWATITGTVGDSVSGILLTIGSLWDEEIREQFGEAWGLIGGIISAKVSGGVDGAIDAVTGMPGRIADAAEGMWDGIVDGFRQALAQIAGGWNGLKFPAFDIPSVTVPGLGEIGGGRIGGWDLPDMPIPKFHSGGLVEGLDGQEVLAKLLPGERVLNEADTRAFDAMGGLAAMAAVGENGPELLVA